jgi:putative membrane protein
MRRLHRLLFGTLVASQVGYSRLSEARRPAATRAIVLLMLATSLAEAHRTRGARGAGLVLAAGGIGFGAELVGVATGRPFGHYTYGPGLGAKVGGVPVLAAAAWGLMSRPAWVTAGLIDERPAVRVPLAAGALTAWDVFLDPRMVRDGYWSWPAGGRYEGIPLSNFAGWFATALGVFSVWAALDRHDDPARTGDGALALYGWTWIGETFATAAIWRRLPVAVAGALAMGAFALPAALRRRGARRRP